MTDSMIPYSFVPGTKANAGEVNANFKALANEIDTTRTTLNQAVQQFNNTLTYDLNSLAEDTYKKEEMDESLVRKADVDLGNTDENIDYVVESWVAEDYSSWYRVYRSGWIEQGGHEVSTITGAGYAQLDRTFPMEFPNECISFVAVKGGKTVGEVGLSTGGDTSCVASKTNFGVRFRENYGRSYYWRADGY